MEPGIETPSEAELQLRGLAKDVFEHGTCHWCRCNAANGLELLGLLDDVSETTGLSDPRAWPDDERKSWVAEYAARSHSHIA